LAALATIATDRSKNVLAGLHQSPTLAQKAHALTSGFDRAFLVGGFIALCGALLALTLPNRSSHVATVEQSARDHAALNEPVAAEH
jgi:hypothetical protein